jgi:hypothetical protein
LELVTWMASCAKPKLQWHAKCDSWQRPASHCGHRQEPHRLSQGEAAAVASDIQDMLGGASYLSPNNGSCLCLKGLACVHWDPTKCVSGVPFPHIETYMGLPHLPLPCSPWLWVKRLEALKWKMVGTQSALQVCFGQRQAVLWESLATTGSPCCYSRHSSPRRPANCKRLSLLKCAA